MDIEKIADEYSPRLRSVATQLCGCSIEAEDLVQDVLLVVLNNKSKFRHQSHVYTWLCGILKYTYWRHRRRKSKLISKMEKIREQKPEYVRPYNEYVEETEKSAELWKLVDKLSQDMRKTVRLKFIDGLTLASIAEKMDCPLGTVKSRMSHATSKLRKFLSESPQTVLQSITHNP